MALTVCSHTKTKHYEKSCALRAGASANYQTVFKEPYILQRHRGKNNGGPRAIDGKTPSLSSSSWEDNNHLFLKSGIRKLTPVECERLQTLPDNYTEGVSNNQRYKMVGNGWTVDVISHILKSMGNKKDEQLSF